MIRVRVFNTSHNVFALMNVEENDEAFKLVEEWVLDGFRVEIIPIVEPDVPVYDPYAGTEQ
jgi:hypothetical protein